MKKEIDSRYSTDQQLKTNCLILKSGEKYESIYYL